MIYWKRADGAQPPMRVLRARWSSLAAFGLFAVGAGLYAATTETAQVMRLLGILAFAGAAACAALVLSTGVQRIVGDEVSSLDPLELDLRSRAMARAYQTISALALLGLLYAQIAADTSDRLALWTPTMAEHGIGVFWGALLVFALTPATFLAWMLPADAGEAA